MWEGEGLRSPGHQGSWDYRPALSQTELWLVVSPRKARKTQAVSGGARPVAGGWWRISVLCT